MASYKIFVLALAVVALLKSVTAQTPINIEFDAVKGRMEDLFDTLKVALLEYQPEHLRLDVEGHLVLAPQRPNKASPPDHLIHLHVTGEHNDETTIYIAVDDLYVCGFANKTGDKFILEGYNNFFPIEHKLDFGREYSKLHDGGIEKLHTVPLGRRSMLHAVHAFTWHNPVLGDPVIVREQARLGVTRFALMVSESLRLTPIRDSFAPWFDLENFIAFEDRKLIQGWGEASKQLLRWHDGKTFDVSEKLGDAKIYDATTGLEKVDVILRKY